MGRRKKSRLNLKKIGIRQLVFLTFLTVVVVGSVVKIFPMWLAAILALVVGLINITKKETQKTLIAGLVVLFGSGLLLAFSEVPFLGDYLGSLFNNLAVYLGIVTIISGIKEIIWRSRS